jgi:predicted GNAT family acetyltransferase
MAIRIEHETGRFVARVDGHVAFVEYERHGDVLDALHTFTPPALRGRAIAAALTRAVIEYVCAQGLRLRPTCSYTRRYLAQHPDTGVSVDEG